MVCWVVGPAGGTGQLAGTVGAVPLLLGVLCEPPPAGAQGCCGGGCTAAPALC